MKRLLRSLSDSYEINLCTSVNLSEDKKKPVTINCGDVLDFQEDVDYIQMCMTCLHTFADNALACTEIADKYV